MTTTFAAETPLELEAHGLLEVLQAMHVDPGTSNYKYTRTEVETLIAMTTALLRVMTLP